MSFTVEQKSQLAKLLATENLTVEHQKISTAKFDMKNRVLYLPIWQNMDGFIYDLLVGHEVGHALYTPAEGWHDAVSETDKNKNYKNFLNVVEDARIEKKIKRKYPGLNLSFRNAYQDLTNRDFFGIRGRDVNVMPFIDRLNLFSKSQWTSTWIKFSANEEILVKEVQSAETWDDVVRITEKIYAYSKEEQYEKMMEEYESDLESYGDDFDSEYNDDYGDGYDDDYDSDDESDSNGSSSSDEEGEEETENTSGSSDLESSDGGGLDNQDSQNRVINHNKVSEPGSLNQFDPECQTDEVYRQNEFKLLDDKCKEFVYVDIPKPISNNIFTPAKRVQELMTKYYSQMVKEGMITADKGIKLLNSFKNRNERYVSLLAKEFEMRKAANVFSKSKLSDTGDIDINKLASYKFDDNIFRKVMLTPKGKNHGLVLLLDRSGSMSRNMAGSIEQIMILSMFCRKVNIPFVVYGFTECQNVRQTDLGIPFSNIEATRIFNNEYNFTEKYSSFTKNTGELQMHNVHMREYLNSQMSNVEYTSALKNMCMLMAGYSERKRYHSDYVPVPDSEQLHNTPLNQALVATAQVMKNFKRKNNLDITSLVVVHDGDADYLNEYYVEKTNNEGNKIKSVDWFKPYERVYYLRDKANKFERKISSNNDEFSKMFYDWFRKVTGSRIFGFFIVEGGRSSVRSVVYNRYVLEDGKSFQQILPTSGRDFVDEKIKLLMKKFKDEKYLASKFNGFDNFFLIQGGQDLTTDDDDEIEVEGKITARKLASAFAKYNKKRSVNRVLVSRFIQGIAA